MGENIIAVLESPNNPKRCGCRREMADKPLYAGNALRRLQVMVHKLSGIEVFGRQGRIPFRDTLKHRQGFRDVAYVGCCVKNISENAH